MKHKHSHIEIVNKRSSYNNIYIKQKTVHNVSSSQLIVKTPKSEQNN